MGQASASSSSTSAINAPGTLTINKPNWVAWVVIGVVALFVGIAWVKKHK